MATESEDGDEGLGLFEDLTYAEIYFLFILGEILLASDSLSRVLAQYERLVRQDHLIKDDNVLPFMDDILPTPKSSAPQALIDLAGSSNGKSIV